MLKSAAAIVCVGAITACAGTGSTPGTSGPAVSRFGGPVDVSQPPNTLWLTYNAPVNPAGMVVGPHSTIWLTGTSSGCLFTFVVQPTSLGTAYCLTGFSPGALTIGADGKFYIDNLSPPPANKAIGVGTTGGAFTTYAIPSGDTPTLGLTRGPDGNVWFVEPAHVAKITPLGSISEYSYPSGEVRNVNSGAAVGADKNVWFTVTSHVLGKPNLIANINPSTSKITEHVLLSKCTTPAGLASNVDGFLYVGCASSQGSIVQVATSGAQTSLSLGGLALSPGLGVVTSSGRGQILVAAGGSLAKLDAPTGEVIVFAPPFNASFSGVLFGPDQNLYALTSGGLVIHIVDRLVVSPTSIEFPLVGQKATITAQYVGSGKLTAGSSNLKVASVAPGAPGSFTVKSTGNGTADITVQDGRGNYATVVVTSP